MSYSERRRKEGSYERIRGTKKGGLNILNEEGGNLIKREGKREK